MLKLPSVIQLSETVVLGALTVIGYAAAFAYEAGVAQAYGIPKELIDVRISTIFLAIGGLVVIVAMPVVQTLQLVRTYLPRDRRMLRYLKSLIILSLAVVIFFAAVGQAFRTIRIGLAVTLALMLLMKVGVPMIRFRHTKAFKEKLRLAAELEYAPASNSRTLLIGSVRVRAVLFDLFVAAALLPLTYAYGVGEAANRKVYWVVHGNPETVVLRIYGDSAVVATFDRKSKSIQPVHKIVPIAQGDVTFTAEAVGPLTIPGE